MRSVAAQGERCRVDRLHSSKGIAFDAGDLHQSADWIAGHAQMMLNPDFSGVFNLVVAAAERGGEPGRRHRTGYSDFTLASDFGPGDRSIHLAQGADGRRSQEEGADSILR